MDEQLKAMSRRREEAQRAAPLEPVVHGCLSARAGARSGISMIRS